MGNPTIFSGQFTKLLTPRGVLKQNGSILDYNGPINYIPNYGAEVNTLGWNLYNDGASNVPVDGTGGVVSGLTLSRNTTSPLHGSADLKLVQTNSTNVQGQGLSYDFSIDSAHQARVLAIRFDFNASSNFVAGDGKTAPLNDGTTTTNSGNSDLEVFIYDVTNSKLLFVTPQILSANGANNYEFSGVFQTSSNSTSYRLILHCATSNANATGWSVKLDNVYVGPQVIPQGAPVTDWQAYTPATQGFGTISNVNMYWRRNGGDVEIFGSFTNGTNTAVQAQLGLPSGLVGDPTKIISPTSSLPTGQWTTASNSSIAYGNLLMAPSASYLGFAFRDSSNASSTYQNASAIIPNATTVYVYGIKVPISGWASSVQMSNDADTRVVTAHVNTLGSTSVSSGAAFTFTNTAYDSHGAIQTNGVFKVPVSGYYDVVLGGFYSNTTNGNIGVYVNGVARVSEVVSITSSGGARANAKTQVKVVAGDLITIVASTSSLTLNDTNGYAIFTKVSGPATIAASETIAASYFISSNLSYTANTAINFDTEEFDTHGVVTTGSGWKFTTPASGIYQVSLFFSNTADSAQVANIYKNGIKTKTLIASNYTNSNAPTMTTLIKLVAGDYIDIRSTHNQTLNGSASNTDGSACFVDIIKR